MNTTQSEPQIHEMEKDMAKDQERIAELVAQRDELKALLKEILELPDNEMKGVKVRLPYSLEAEARAVIARCEKGAA